MIFSRCNRAKFVVPFDSCVIFSKLPRTSVDQAPAPRVLQDQIDGARKKVPAALSRFVRQGQGNALTGLR